MRVQVERSILVRARAMARLLGIPSAHGVGLVVELFAWALETSPDGAMFGRIDDDQPGELVEAAAGWTGTKGDLYAAMVRFGLIGGVLDPEEDLGPDMGGPYIVDLCTRADDA